MVKSTLFYRLVNGGDYKIRGDLNLIWMNISVSDQCYQLRGYVMGDFEGRFTFYPAQIDKKWIAGDGRGLKMIKRVGGYQDVATAVRNEGRDVMRAIEGLDNNIYIPTHSSVEVLAEQAMTEIRQSQAALKESIKTARKDELYDLVDEYQRELDDLERHTKGSFVDKYRSKQLDKGDTMKKMTSAARSRRRTVIKNLRKEGLSRMADDVEAHYHVGDRYITYFSGEISHEWILEPPRESDS